MIINKGDNSTLRYERDLRTLVVKPGHTIKARLRARHRRMYLHARVLTEDARLVEVKTDNYMLPIYSLYLEESKGGIITKQAEFLCGLSAHDPKDCWQIIRRYDTLPFQDIEAILEEHGYPDTDSFDKKCKAGVNNYARYHNLVRRGNFDTTLIEMIEVREMDSKK